MLALGALERERNQQPLVGGTSGRGFSEGEVHQHRGSGDVPGLDDAVGHRGRERMACFKAFLHNNWVGAAIFAGIVVDFLVSGRSFG